MRATLSMLVAAGALAGCHRFFNATEIPELVDGPGVDAIDGTLDSADGPLPMHVATLAAGMEHTCAAASDGSVRCWGHFAFGRLGYAPGMNIGDSEPASSADLVDVGGAVVRLTAGAEHTCALLNNGSVRCWGRGAGGRLGHADMVDIGEMVTPASRGDLDFGLGKFVLQMSAGAAHTCAVTGTRNVHCWGFGLNGRLGLGHTNDIGDNETPELSVNLSGEPVTAVAAGGAHTCALLASNYVRCWGANASGQLGIMSTADHLTPSGNLSLGNGTITKIAAGDAHTCAIVGGNVVCWGEGSFGRLGYGNSYNIGDDEVPSMVGAVSLGEAVVDIAVGGAHTCARTISNTVRCWGANSKGELGYGNIQPIGDTEVPAVAGTVNVGGVATELALGAEHTCAVMETGAVRCWGRADSGQLGYGNPFNIGDGETPASAGDVPVF